MPQADSISYKRECPIRTFDHPKIVQSLVIPFVNNDIALPVFMECAVMRNKLGSLFYIKRDLLTEMV